MAPQLTRLRTASTSDGWGRFGSAIVRFLLRVGATGERPPPGNGGVSAASRSTAPPAALVRWGAVPGRDACGPTLMQVTGQRPKVYDRPGSPRRRPTCARRA